MLDGGYQMIGLPLSTSAFHRFAYVKEHVLRENDCAETFPPGRTAYFVNLPLQIDESWLRKALVQFGTIDRVKVSHFTNTLEFQAPEKTFYSQSSTANVVFSSKVGLQTLLQTKCLEQSISPLPHVGLTRYLKSYEQKRPGFEAIQRASDAFMKDFDTREENEILRRKTLSQQTDDDGFKTVVHSKRALLLESERVIKKPKKKEKHDFYRFQTREKKRDQLKELRERFEQDRKVIAELKRAKMFHPET